MVVVAMVAVVDMIVAEIVAVVIMVAEVMMIEVVEAMTEDQGVMISDVMIEEGVTIGDVIMVTTGDVTMVMTDLVDEVVGTSTNTTVIDKLGKSCLEVFFQQVRSTT